MNTRCHQENNKGIALAIAVTLSLVISLTAAIVLNLTFKRFYLSSFQEDRTLALNASEAGLQYVIARLTTDGGFRTAVENDTTPTATPVYIISSLTDANAKSKGHISAPESVDETTDDLQLGAPPIKTKDVTVKIYNKGGGRYELHTRSTYGTTN